MGFNLSFLPTRVNTKPTKATTANIAAIDSCAPPTVERAVGLIFIGLNVMSTAVSGMLDKENVKTAVEGMFTAIPLLYTDPQTQPAK